MPLDEVSVISQTLTRHATGIDSVAAQVAQAKQAGDTVRLDGQAYGKLCWAVPLMINSLQDIVLDALGAADASLRETAQRLRAAADRYDQADHTAQERIGLVP
jgi:Excreted virulence factor EspC, type VII ESX diderm